MRRRLGGQFATVESAGDVNGDGYGDVLVGASFSTVGGVNFAGKVWLYLGGPMGLGRMPSWSFGGTIPAAVGISVSFLGDTNGDGYGDVVVGAHLESEGAFGSVGAAYIFRGRLEGLEVIANQRLVGPAEDVGVFGNSVRSAGDLNGDQIPDLIVGTPRRILSAQRRSGRAFIFLGDGRQLGPMPHRVYEGNTPLDSYGHGASTVGDLNGDGRADIAMGASGADGDILRISSGIIDIVYGAAVLPRLADLTLVGARERAGLGIAIGSDLDSDGFSDLITSARTDDAGDAVGMVRWYRGSVAGLVVGAPSTLRGPELGSGYGASLAAVGDIDRDGTADVFVGAPGTNLLMLPGAGVTYQMTLRFGTLTAIRALFGERPMQGFGYVLTSSF